MKWNPFNTSVGLALGGGAAKGIAHIGILKAFEEEGVEISYLSGTSIGALVAGYYAFGKTADEMLTVGEALSFKRMTSFSLLKKGGFFTTDAIKEMILDDIGDVKIEDAIIPLAICTTDIVTGEQVIFEKGSLADAICASVAVPGLFTPVEIDGRKLVDGGLVENVPVSLVEGLGAGIVIGVDLNGVKHYPEPSGMIDVLGNAIDICMDLKTRDQLKRADIVISLDLNGYSRSDNSDRIEALVMEGYHPMKAKIRKLLWFKRANLIRYLVKVLKAIVPLKVPELIKRKLKETLPIIKIN
ncbi:patatin-like phospholipase family protein [Alkalimarinus alittae]|uniref:Patatin-like phospholipase family protein n=1 Tax=Alkalimarinus alittae TaxID=2961619 RepID=A0ABY6N3D9_9ALTE|nr:patatin-like phospholipase family protein [Alkalimarinus alittae]UZE96588.1 patatin-like phospholipase family protein [Alkalimarinus alittae]